MNKDQKNIFRLFLEHSKIRFSEIEKAVHLRSNLLSYHLGKMQQRGMMEKKGDYYVLTEQGEKLLPLFPQEQLSPLPVVLVALMNKNKILLMKRNKRPYRGYWSLIGGRVLLPERLQETCLRLIREKAGLKAIFCSLNAIVHEQVESEGVIKHSFLLFFNKAVTAEQHVKEKRYGELRWFTLSSLRKEKVIPSDKWLMQHKLHSTLKINEVSMQERENQTYTKSQK